jgi:hypothetical protein
VEPQGDGDGVRINANAFFPDTDDGDSSRIGELENVSASR